MVTFACELWVLSDTDVKSLEISKGSQVDNTSTANPPTGWLRLKLFVYVKKVLFLNKMSQASMMIHCI